MKTENKLPFISNGWLIAGQNASYGNTPVIQISQISGFTYYEDTTDGYKNGDWYIRFTCSSGSLDWKYNTRDNMNEDYYIIVRLVAGDKTLKDRTYI